MNRIVSVLLVVALVIPYFTAAQKEKITVEDIWAKYAFFQKRIPGFKFLNDGKHYSRLEAGNIVKYDITTGESVGNILDTNMLSAANFNSSFSSYAFNHDESKIVLQTEREQIYRHSSRANFHVWDVSSGKMTPVSAKGKQRYATLAPDGGKIGFVRNNNLFYKDLKSGKEVQITRDGKENAIINGATDWVYEEEFSMSRAFEWSTDGSKIAFMRFDETDVKEWMMTNYSNGLYPEHSSFKYPKAGEENALISCHIFDLESGKVSKVNLGDKPDMYIPRIKWQDDDHLIVFHMNRHQNELDLVRVHAASGKTNVLLAEKNEYYIKIHDDLTFLKDGSGFVWLSEKDGFNHIYLHDAKGKLIKQITKGDYDVTKFYGMDEKNGLIYYQSAEVSPMDREVYSIDLKGKNKTNLTPEKGTNSAQFSKTFDYFVSTHNSLNAPSTYKVCNREGKEVRMIEDNYALKALMTDYDISPVEQFSLKTGDDIQLNGWMIKPPDFTPGVKYPVFMYVYGGPNSQTAKNSFGGPNFFWFQILAQKGYIVVSIDNRGTGGRGEAFRKMTYQQLGKYETIDQIASAKWLGEQSYVDASRIGIFGWSYGGYLSSLCLLKGNDVFKAAIAVAPVTNWKWYDTIYTERYMRTPKENPNGYEDNSPVNFADRLKGNYLLVHGTGDDNVHAQNSYEMMNALIAANKQFDMYLYPNRNHGIYGGVTRLHLYNKMTNFLLENL